MSVDRPDISGSEKALAWLRHYHPTASAACVGIIFFSHGRVVPIAGLALSVYFSLIGQAHFPPECARCTEVASRGDRHAHCLRVAHLYFLYPHVWPVPAAFVVWALLEPAPWSPLIIGAVAAAGLGLAGCLDVHARYQRWCEECREDAW